MKYFFLSAYEWNPPHDVNFGGRAKLRQSRPPKKEEEREKEKEKERARVQERERERKRVCVKV